MKLLLKLLMFVRAQNLSRQARVMRQVVDALPKDARSAAATQAVRAIQGAGRSRVPHLYGVENVHLYQPWSDVATQAVAKAQSGALQLRVRGVALWLAVVYHETRNAEHGGLAAVHREALGMLGDLRGSYEARTRNDLLDAAV